MPYVHLEAGNIHERRVGGDLIRLNIFYAVLCFYFYRHKGKQSFQLSTNAMKSFRSGEIIFSAHVMRMMQSLALFTAHVFHQK